MNAWQEFSPAPDSRLYERSAIDDFVDFIGFIAVSVIAFVFGILIVLGYAWEQLSHPERG
jgi:hypothetical protein